MESRRIRWRAILAGLLLGTLAVTTVACRPRLVVRMSTIVYDDGSLTRRLELSGTKADGSKPTEPGWLTDEAGVWLSAPDAWESLEEAPDRLRVEGFFPDVGSLPGTFDLEVTESDSRSARLETRLAVDERVIVRRRDYSEHHGDPYGPTEAAQAIDRIIEMAVHAFDEELEGFLGSAVDPAPAEDLLRTEGRVLLTELLAAGRMQPGALRISDRVDQWQIILRRHGVPLSEAQEEGRFWSAQIPVLLYWARQRVATAISTPEFAIGAEELTFWPAGEDWESAAGQIAERVWGGDEALLDEAEPYLNTLMGYYGRDETPNFLFESRVQLPGVLLQTNGTPDGSGIVWLFRDGDLGYGERLLQATTAEPLDEPLRTLGARRVFDPAALTRLVDLLWKRDIDNALATVLARAVDEGKLDLLRDEDELPDEVESLAAELADLLDPEVPLPQPL